MDVILASTLFDPFSLAELTPKRVERLLNATTVGAATGMGVGDKTRDVLLGRSQKQSALIKLFHEITGGDKPEGYRRVQTLIGGKAKPAWTVKQHAQRVIKLHRAVNNKLERKTFHIDVSLVKAGEHSSVVTLRNGIEYLNLEFADQNYHPEITPSALAIKANTELELADANHEISSSTEWRAFYLVTRQELTNRSKVKEGELDKLIDKLDSTTRTQILEGNDPDFLGILALANYQENQTLADYVRAKVASHR
ncbi:MAG: hypothetical protein ACPGUD_14105 [Parashewanella sp.]